jgi:hypothetical protein
VIGNEPPKDATGTTPWEIVYLEIEAAGLMKEVPRVVMLHVTALGT